jgi:hypothetical protein
MTNEEMYEVVVESLQNDINDEKITFEFGNILNDIAYEAFIEGTELSDEVSGILDRYLTEATADMEDEESVQESADDDSTDDDVINESVMNIITAYENAEITEDECKLLLESAGVDIDEVFTEAGESPVAAFNAIKKYDYALLSKIKPCAESLQAMKGGLVWPTWEELSRKFPGNFPADRQDDIAAKVELVKNSLQDPTLVSLASSLHPQRLLDNIPSKGAMSSEKLTQAVNATRQLLSQQVIAAIEPALRGKKSNVNANTLTTFDNKKRKLFKNATSNPVEVEKKELSKQDQAKLDREKAAYLRKKISSQKKYGAFS